MSFLKPFNLRAPDFRQVDYEFTFPSEAEAQSALAKIKDKRYTINADGDYILPVGRRIKSRDEAASGNVLTFVGQLKAGLVAADNPEMQAMEAEIASGSATMTGKTIRS